MQRTEEQHTVPKGFAPGKLIVKFKPGASEEVCNRAHEAIGAKPVRLIPELGLQIVEVDCGKEGACRCGYLHCEDVAFAEPNYRMTPDYKPNDPFFTEAAETSAGRQSQWALHRINAGQAWAVTRLLPPSVKIAVIDSGIDPDHPDLAGKIVDPINFSTDDPNDWLDRSGHGTFVAGIAAAVTDNRTGIAGASFNAASILPVKAGSGDYELIPILFSIVHAVKQGARVLQMSFTMPVYSTFFQDAVRYAWENGAVCVASAGNACNEQAQYPAGLCYVLGVSAVNRDNDLAWFSNWGIPVGVAAPGVDILSTTPTYAVPGCKRKYDALSGTSFASPFVSGVAALLLAANPALTNAEVVQIIQRSARPVVDEPAAACLENTEDAKEWSPFFGYGLLDAGSAVRMALQSMQPQEGSGCFYGIVVDRRTGLPADGATVLAKSGVERLRAYSTKTNVPTTDDGLLADGMFRLMNLPAGTYDLHVCLDGCTAPQQAATAAIVPGADVYLRLEA